MTDGEVLPGWTRGSHTAGGVRHDTFRRGTGPGVVVVHEIPGITPEVVAFADEVVHRGFTVVMPHLFGTPGRGAGPGHVAQALRQVCVNSEFVKLALDTTAPVAGWLRSLARDLHDELGGPGVGALGMCFTGGYALAMMVEESVVAPVLAQPSTPFGVGRRRAADVGLSPDDLAIVRRRAAEGCAVLGLRYAADVAVGSRFDTLRAELGDRFAAVEFPGRRHATLTAHRQQEAVDAVLDFLDARLRTPGGPA